MNKTTDREFYVRLSPDTAAIRGSEGAAWETILATGGRRIGPVVSRIEKFRETIGRDDPAGVSVFLETVRSVFVPEALFDAAAVEGYLAANGWELRDGERIVVSTAAAGIIALMPWPSAETDPIQTASGDTARFWSPIQLLAADPVNDSISIRVAGDTVYLAVFDRSLQYAEVLPCHSTDDLLFYLKKLEERFPVRKMTVRLSGDDSAVLRKGLRQYYKRVVSEDESQLIGGFAARTSAEKKE